MNNTPGARAPGTQEDRWSGRLILWVTVLILANVMADEAISAPLMVLPQMLEHFDTDQAALLNASAMLAGAIWSPLLGKSADVFGTRRILLVTLLVACAGGLICLAAPNVEIFLMGRFLQGAAMASVFITVALTRQICSPQMAMLVIGIVTSGSSIAGIIEPLLLAPLIDQFGYQSVFVVSALFAAVAALCVRFVIPESPVRGGGRIDVGGALLLGGGLAAVLAYISLGSDLGWLSGGMILLLAAGAAALVGWVVVALRIDEPIIDLRILNSPLVLTLLTLVLSAGSFRSMLQLTGLIAQVPPDLGLGYGLGNGEMVGVLFAAPPLGIMLGGTFAGWLATRIGPAQTLLGGITIGATATFAMLAGVSVLPLALVCGTALGIAAGTIITSGFNLATSITTPERHGMVTGLVSVILAIGSVVVNIAGTEILKATDIMVDGDPVNSATGVYLYVLMAAVLFVLAAVPAIMLMRNRRAAPLNNEAPQYSGSPR